MKFLFSLEKGSRKFLCPNCRRKTFVRYVNTQDGNYLSRHLGRCDREQKCGYFRKPQSNTEFQFTSHVILEPKASYHSHKLVINYGKNFKQNHFVQFLKTLFTKDQVKGVILRYLLGTSSIWSGATVFWQIDQNNKIRNGKIMLYDPASGSRKKNGRGKAYISNIKSVLGLKNFHLKQCLFGLHLIQESRPEVVAVVESEKTAIIMSLCMPQYIWMATGGKQNFKYELMKDLRGFKILAFPDKGAYLSWQEKAIEMNESGLHIVVNDFLEESDCPEGTDIADIYLKDLNKDENTTESESSAITEFQTDPQKILSSAELVALQMNEINPFIKTLINEFGLTDENGLDIRLD